MTTKAYLISASTAAALGFTGGFQAAGLSERDGVARLNNVEHTFELSTGAVSALEGWLANNAVPELGAVSVDDLFDVCVRRPAAEESGQFKARIEGLVGGENAQVSVPLGNGATSQIKTYIVAQACGALNEKAPATTCSASNIFDVCFRRPAPPGVGPWRARVEAIFSETCAEGAPE